MKSRLLVVDVETGGLDPTKHALLSIAVVDSRDGEVFTAIVRPSGECLVDEDALKVNGFTHEFLKKNGRSEGDVMAELCLWMGARRDAVLAGQNVSFDRSFLMAALARTRAPWPMGYRSLDLMSAAWLAWESGALDLEVGTNGQPKLALNSIAKACGLARAGKVHDALEDAELTLACLRKLTRVVEMSAQPANEEVTIA